MVACTITPCRAAVRLNSALGRMFKISLLLAILLLACSCSQQPADTVVPPPPPPPPDVGDIGSYLHCSAQPKRTLSEREQCEVAAFKSRCTKLDDCYVSCIASPDGSFSGGRCAHTCTFGPHRGAEPPKSLASCATLPGRSGMDVE